jgi:phosphopantothenoylcysteine decarboxylase/phosphopantothenate--cysteine ligase
VLALGAAIVEPESGFLAEREHGVGRLAAEPAILAALDATVRRTNELAGQRVVVTAGPTREPVDPVRFLSSASTGTTGIELAREALRRGAAVDLILGPTLLPPPAGARVAQVTTALEMRAAVLAAAERADVVVASAAVSDFRPAERHEQKVKKEHAETTLALERNPDILAELGARKNGTFLVGFAAETGDLERNAREKLRAKRLDAIAANDVSGGRGFGTGANELVLLWGESGRRELGAGAKAELAARFWDALAELRGS